MELPASAMKYQAHRGVSTEFPENTMPAFRAALEQGYDYIETDPHFTADRRCVLIHDSALRRTCRTEDGKEIPDGVVIENISYQEALGYDAGAAVSPDFKGTRIPLLSELLEITRNTDVTVKIDNRFQSFSESELSALFDLVETAGAKVAFTCSDLKFIRLVHDRLPQCELHYDGYVDEETVQAAVRAADFSPLYIWLGLDTPKIVWAKVPKATPALCSMVKRYARLGIWILSAADELETARQLGADLIETDGNLKPKKKT